MQGCISSTASGYKSAVSFAQIKKSKHTVTTLVFVKKCQYQSAHLYYVLSSLRGSDLSVYVTDGEVMVEVNSQEAEVNSPSGKFAANQIHPEFESLLA